MSTLLEITRELRETSWTAADLWARYTAAKEAGAARLTRRLIWDAWIAQSCREGNPPDALRRHARSRSERFDACCIEGLDGCLIWDGPVDHRGNPRIPSCGHSARKFQFERHGVEVRSHRRIMPTCGSALCVRFEHLEIAATHWGRSYTDEQMIGRLQVVAMQLGHSPQTREWDERGEKPSSSAYQLRFGLWSNALRKAGLPVGYTRAARQTETHFACGCERTPENSLRNGTRADGSAAWTCRRCKLVSQRRYDAKRRGAA